MKNEELKTFLRLRGLRVSGSKPVLVARAFCAIENKIPIMKTAEEVEGEIEQEYSEKLKVEGITLPDPFTLKTGWMNEEEGIVFWPLVTTFYVINFLMLDSEVEDLSDYKGCKAYSYFKQGWLANVFYHQLGSSKYCLLKADCRPSERLRDVPHKLWICFLEKEGKVVKAHCTCMAGMSSTCNHIAALLFRLEAAMRLGLINTSCTSKSCEWLPNRKEVKPQKIKDLNLNREDFGKIGKPSKKICSTPKKNYDPLLHSIMKPLSFLDIAKGLEQIIPGSVLYTGVPKPEEPQIDFVREVVKTSENITGNLISIDDVIIMSKSEDEFLKNIDDYFTEHNIAKIEESTRKQSKNPAWFHFRKGVVTASKSHEVKTKMEKIDKGRGGNINMWSLIQKISGFTFTNPNIPALKYGREMEAYAANKFVEIFAKDHKKVSKKECGLFLDSSYQYIGASPDGIITCSCHEAACLEIKCPYSISYTSPCDLNVALPYLKIVDGKKTLNRSHQYYTQCQQQMGVTGLKLCYFFVYTSHGYFLEEIPFDEEFWKSLKEKISTFYTSLFLKSIYK